MTLKEIMIAGKLTISEGGGGGGGDYEMGIITVDAATQKLTIPVSKQYENFHLMMAGAINDWVTNSTERTSVWFYGATGWYAEMDCNSGKGDLTKFDRTPGWRGDGVVFTDTEIKVAQFGNGALAWYPAGASYLWVAW